MPEIQRRVQTMWRLNITTRRQLLVYDWIARTVLVSASVAFVVGAWLWVKYDLEHPRRPRGPVDLYVSEQDFRQAIAHPERPKPKMRLELKPGDQLHIFEGVGDGAIVEVDSGRHRGVRGWVPGAQLKNNLED